MAEQTRNFGLTKDAKTDYYNIDTVNANLDKIDMALGNTAMFETAGGTGTAITLTGIELLDGHSKTFIVNTDNNGSATTINGKSLYKPGTINAPNLKKGKAVTVWYDAAGDCFFLKASATGNATADKVLAPYTFSSDDDTDIVGEIPTLQNNTPPLELAYWAPGVAGNEHPKAHMRPPKGYVDGGTWLSADVPGLLPNKVLEDTNLFGMQGSIPIINEDKEALYAGHFSGHITVRPQYGMWDGVRLAYKYDPNYAAMNIRKGVSIFGLEGNFSDNLIDFPLTIHPNQPAPQRDGHIWVDASNGWLINSIHIVEALHPGIPDNSLIFVVGATEYRNFYIADQLTLTDDGGNKPIYMGDNTGGEWRILGKHNGYQFINKPFVYSKIDGVVDVETAYMWNGSGWVLLSQKGHYLVEGQSNWFRAYNKVGDAFSLSQDIRSIPSGGDLKACKDGRYVLIGRQIYRRVGDTYVHIGEVPPFAPITTDAALRSVAISGDGNTVVGMYVKGDSNNYKFFIVSYRDNGNGFSFEFEGPWYNSYSQPASTGWLECSHDGRLIMAQHVSSGYSYGVAWFRTAGGIVKGGEMAGVTSGRVGAISYDGQTVILHYNQSGTMKLGRFTVNYADNSIHLAQEIGVSSNELTDIIGVHPAGYMVVRYGSYNIAFYRFTDLARFSCSTHMGGYAKNVAFNISGDRMAVGYDNSSPLNYYSVSINTSNNTVTVTFIKNVYNNSAPTNTPVPAIIPF